MPFPFSRTKKEELVAILDVGSSSVGGALVSLKENTTPEVLFSVREDMVFQSDLNLERFLSSMLQALEHVLGKLEKSGAGKPRKFFCVLSSPWYESETKTMSIKEEESFIVTHKILDEFIEKEASEFREAISKNGKMKDPAQVIEMQNIQIKLNGYETSNPYGKRAKNMEVALFIGLGSKKILEAIESRVLRIFSSSKIRFSTFSLSAFSTVRDIFTDRDNFLLLDITGEVTDITIVKDDVLVRTISFPMGKNFIMRRIASGMNTTPEEAKSLLNIVQTGKSDEATKKQMESVLLSAWKEWLGKFTQAVASFSKEVSIPSTVFFTADPGVADWFIESIEKEEFGQFTMATETFDVRFLDAKVLEKFCSFKDGVPKDPFIILEAIFADRSRDTF